MVLVSVRIETKNAHIFCTAYVCLHVTFREPYRDCVSLNIFRNVNVSNKPHRETLSSYFVHSAHFPFVYRFLHNYRVFYVLFLTAGLILINFVLDALSRLLRLIYDIES